MAVPTGAYKLLRRKRSRLSRRREQLVAELEKVDADLKAVERAWTALQAPNGSAVGLAKIIKGIRRTKKDDVLAVVRSSRSKGITRGEIAERLRKKGTDVPANSVTTYLFRLRQEDFVEFDGERWYAKR